MKAFILLLFATAAVSGLAQATPSSVPLEVSVQVHFDGYDMPDGEAVHAPGNFFLSPFVRTTLPLRAGDTVTIDIYADGRPLLSQKAVWYEEFDPSKNARPGEAIPMIIRPAQFFYKFIDWTNVPEGR